MHPKTEELIKNTLLIEEMAEEKFRSRRSSFLHPLLRDEKKIHNQALKYALAAFVGTNKSLTIDGMVCSITLPNNNNTLLPVFTISEKNHSKPIFQFACSVLPSMPVRMASNKMEYYDEDIEGKLNMLLIKHNAETSIQHSLSSRIIEFLEDSGYVIKCMHVTKVTTEKVVAITVQLVSKIKNDYEFADVSIALPYLE